MGEGYSSEHLEVSRDTLDHGSKWDKRQLDELAPFSGRLAN